jgi:D-sedoheptulose 7-phosphate isomerase
MPTTEKLNSMPDTERGYALHYLSHLSERLSQINPDEVADLIRELESARTEGSTVFLAGNGGSAATASHMANDFGIGLHSAGSTAIRAVALTDNVPVMTAISNDARYRNVFEDQLKVLYQTGDRLLAISASGNSPNLIAAAEWVKQKGGRVIGLVGFDGGALKGLCDVVVHVRTPRGEYGPVEDAHMVLNHLVVTWFQNRNPRLGSTTKTGI